MAKNRVSETDLTRIKPLSLYANSPEIAEIDPRHVRIIAGTVDYNSANVLGIGPGYNEYDINDEIYELPGVPHLEDIIVIKNVAYTDKKNNVRSKIVFKIKNTSGETINGVDARLEVLGGVEQG